MKWFWLILVLLLLLLLLWRFMRSSGSGSDSGAVGRSGSASQDPAAAAAPIAATGSQLGVQTYADADSADDAGTAVSGTGSATYPDGGASGDAGSTSTSSSDDVGWTTVDDLAWEAESDQADAASTGSVADEGGVSFAQPLGTSEAAAPDPADEGAAPAVEAAPDSTAPPGAPTGADAVDDGDWAARVPGPTPNDGPVDLTADISEDPEVNIPTSEDADTAGSDAAGSGSTPDVTGDSEGSQSAATSGGDSGTVGSGAHEEHAAYGDGSAVPAPDGSGPDGWGVKGNVGSMLYHPEESPYYKRTRAEVWFRDEDTARAAGFTRWDQKQAEAHHTEAAYGKGSAVPTEDGSGPAGWTIKGNVASMRYHSEDSPYYGRTRAEVWFQDEDTARSAGFARWDGKG